jgi:hypothetical protein
VSSDADLIGLSESSKRLAAYDEGSSCDARQRPIASKFKSVANVLFWLNVGRIG